MAIDRQPIEIPFPLKGIDETWAYRRQPQGTSPDALNVRPYDSINHRLRGGQRDGLSKYYADAVNGTEDIQAISQASTALSPGSIVADTLAFEDDFTSYGSDGALQELDSTNWPAAYKNDGSPLAGDREVAPMLNLIAGASGEGMQVTAASDAVTSTDVYRTTTLIKSLTLGDAYVIKVHMQLGEAEVLSDAHENDTAVIFRVNTTNKTCYEIRAEPSTNGQTQVRFVVYLWTSESSRSSAIFNTNYVLVDGADFDDELVWEIRVNGNNVAVYMQDNLIDSFTATLYASDSRIGIQAGWSQDTTHREHFTGNLTKIEIYTGATPASYKQVHTLAVAGGNIYYGNPDSLTLAGSGADALASGRRVAITDAFGIAYFADGYNTGYKKLTLSTGQVATWTPTAGDLPIGSGDTSQACRFLTLYRGRIVAWGLSEDPQNWFMSRVGDPLDWDYNPATTDQIQAVAGHNSNAGKLGGILLCCAAYGDDLMIMGGDHSLWVMRGDPAAGGLIDNISYQTGIAGPDAYAWDPEGNFYFFGAGTLWKIGAGVLSIESISRGRLDQTFGNINYETHQVRLVWDTFTHGLHLYFTPISQPSTSPDHYYWDQQTDSFWRDNYPPTMGPTAVHVYDANDPDDRAILIGGFDSYIRYLDSGQSDDDGTAINSYAYFSPIVAAGDLANIRLIELTAILSADSDPAKLSVYAGESAEQAVEATTPRFLRTLRAGRNVSLRQRINGNALVCKIENDSSTARKWALESLMGIIRPSGKTRHGRL